jgi:uncharacterized protein
MYHPIVIGQFSKMLGNLVNILDKAAEHANAKKFDMEVLLQARLSPDQFTLMRQIQVACDTAKLAAARLADKEKDAPEQADTEVTLAQAKARIQSIIDYLQTFKAADFDDAAGRRITQPRWKGKSLSGEEFLIQHAMPNLYFHVTTAYAIVRHNGVAVGKMDFLGVLPFNE